MKKWLPALGLLLLFSGCKKFIENIQEDKIIDIMVDGQWKVTSYIQDGTNITIQFSGYSFQYHRNKTVDAITGGSVERTGNWDGNVSTKTVWADFPGAPTPLIYLTGTWHIDNNTTTYVVLSQEQNGVINTMRLDKL